MRRYWREPPPSGMFRGAELARLTAGILMLVVLAMMISRAREPSTWRWLVRSTGAPAASEEHPSSHATENGTGPFKASGAQGAGAVSGPSPHTNPLPAGEGTTVPVPPATPTGPTDEDPDEAATAREEFQALTDGTLTLGPEEMEAYDRLVTWVQSQSFERLFKRAKKDVWYSDLHDFPGRHRGELIALDLEVRRARDVGKNRYGVPLHEVWGVTEESRSRWYAAIVVDYPKGMPAGWDIRARAKFAGYFLKLQGYESADALPGRPPERAPLVIGRLEWIPPLTASAEVEAHEWAWGAVALAIVAIALGGSFFLAWRRSKKSPNAMKPRILPSGDGPPIPIDVWLEESGLAEAAGNNSEEEPESH